MVLWDGRYLPTVDILFNMQWYVHKQDLFGLLGDWSRKGSLLGVLL